MKYVIDINKLANNTAIGALRYELMDCLEPLHDAADIKYVDSCAGIKNNIGKGHTYLPGCVMYSDKLEPGTMEKHIYDMNMKITGQVPNENEGYLNKISGGLDFVESNNSQERCKTSSNCSHNTNGRSLDKPCSIEWNYGKCKNCGENHHGLCTKPTPVMESQVSINLAKEFHRIYEELAPQYGYETREDTKEFDPESKNGKLMIAVCERILAGLVL